MNNRKKDSLYCLGIFGFLIVQSVMKCFCERLIIADSLKLALLGTLIIRIVPMIILAILISRFLKKKIYLKSLRIIIGIFSSFLIMGLIPFWRNNLAQSKVYKTPLIYGIKLANDIITEDTTTVEVNSLARYVGGYSFSTGRGSTANKKYYYIEFNDVRVIISYDTYNKIPALSDALDFEDFRSIYQEYKYKLYPELTIMEEAGERINDEQYFKLFCSEYAYKARTLPYQCTIEYYSSSKKIKSIDGYDFATELSEINDKIYSKRLDNIVPLFSETISENEARERKSTVISLISNEKGNQIEIIRTKMIDNGFKENVDFKVILINSKMYPIGTIVDMDYIQEEIPTLYVVGSNESEDLLEFPDLGELTKKEAIMSLKKVGFNNYIADATSNGRHKGYVYTIGEAKGAFVPK